MKQLAKYLVAIGAGLVLIGNAGVAQGAATPTPAFNHNWQYEAPTCESLFVDYPDNLPNPQNANHVNIRIDFDGTKITFNWHTSGTWAPSSTFVYADHPNWPSGVTVYTVEWVQVAESNYHWQGSLECGETPPPTTVPPVVVDPTATLSIECLVDSDYEVKFGIEAGSEDAEYILRVREGNGKLTDGTVAAEGDYSEAVTATLDEGMIVVLRINGERVKSVMVPAACPEPVEPPTTTVPPVEPPVEPPTTTVPPVEPPVTTVPEPTPEPPVEVPVSLGPAQPAEEPAQSLPQTGAGSVIFYLGLICLGFGLPLWALGRLIRK
jgi:hypothetical protein